METWKWRYFGASVEDVARVLADEEIEIALGVRGREKEKSKLFGISRRDL